jgi:hypothetical protein
MTRMTTEEFDSRKAEIEARYEEVDALLIRGIKAMDKMAERSKAKGNSEIESLCNANVILHLALRHFNLETYNTELQILTLEQLYYNVSSTVDILVSEIAKLTRETPDELKKLKEQVAQFEPVMREIRKQVEKKREEEKS